jgi:flagellar basal body-associated protein FliL
MSCAVIHGFVKVGDSEGRNTAYLIVAVLVIIIVVGVAVAYFLISPGGGGGGATATPTPTASSTNDVASATILTFSANVTSQESTITYNLAGKNIHTTPTIRVDFAGYSYLLDDNPEKSWGSTDNGRTLTTSDFATD